MFKKILIVFVLTLFSINLFSQTISSYKPKEKISEAIEHAKDQGLVDPLLTGIGTTSGNIGDIPYTLEYKHETGNASIWLYSFVDREDMENRVSFALVNLVVTTIPFVISPEQLGDIPPLPQTVITDEWMDSGEFADNLLQNETAASFFELTSDEININYVGMGNNEFVEEINFGDVYWTINASGSSDEEPVLTCWTHAITGETLCNLINSVNEIVTDHGNYVYPNPASHNISIPLPNNLLNFKSIKIVNSNGIEIDLDEFNLTDNLIDTDVSNLPIGSYMIQLEDEKSIYIYPLIIKR